MTSHCAPSHTPVVKQVEVTKQNLLVVDADPRSLRVLEVSLRNAGYNVAGCPSVGKAFEILHTNKPDLILMDIQLPDFDGYEATRRIKANSALSSTPVIAVTSYALSGDEAKAYEAGCDAYVAKPFRPRQLLAKVREYV